MGAKASAIYTFVLQLIGISLLVFLFLVIMFVLVGNMPFMILFTPSGVLLEMMLIIYFWLIIFPLSGKNKKSEKSTKKEDEK